VSDIDLCRPKTLSGKMCSTRRRGTNEKCSTNELQSKRGNNKYLRYRNISISGLGSSSLNEFYLVSFSSDKISALTGFLIYELW
jgi:hypothetical protein